MRYQFYTCDVFTEQRFGGNPLAVVPNASGMTTAQMQQIAREFNYSESTFVFPAEQGHTCKVRIFTPTQEVPFAGHPNIGTAFTLANIGAFGSIKDGLNVVFVEKAGLVPIAIREMKGQIWCELKAPEVLSIRETAPVELVAAAVSLSPADIVTRTHQPQVASVGLPFLIAEIENRRALTNAAPYLPAIQDIEKAGLVPDIHLYTNSADDFDIRTRMFAPLDGVPEDPATGSANCALTAMLSSYQPARDGQFSWRIAQGVEMGRPSILNARTLKENGEVKGVWIAGHCVAVSRGEIEVE